MNFLFGSKMAILLPFALLCFLNFTSSSTLYGDVPIGNICRDSTECVGIPEKTSCCNDDKKCECMSDYVPNTQLDDCLKRTLIGENCTDPVECKGGLGGEFSDCLANEEGDKICQCTDEAVPIEAGLGQICERKATIIGDVCHTNEQCTPNLGPLSECENETCQCMKGAVGSLDSKTCLATGVPIGGRCEVHGQCVGEPNSACSNEICVCATEFISSNNRQECLPIRHDAGQTCKEIQQCQKGNMGTLSNCVGNDPNNKLCQCNPDAISAPGDPLCRPKAVHVGDSCKIEPQCLNLDHSECSIQGSCICKNEAVESSDSTKCLLKSYINDACDDVNQCSWITGSTCQNKNVSDPATEKICRCSADYVNVEFARDVCYLKAKAIGQSCALHPIQCIDLDDSQCLRDQKICTCHNLTQVVSGDKKRCLSRVAGLNTTCIESAQCSTQNSECLTTNVELKEKQCKCLRNEYVEGWEQKGKCLKIADDLRVSCEEQHQCTSGLGPLSECKDGYCICKASYTYYDGQCYFPATLNGRCNLDGECKAGVNNYTYCNNNTNRCSCVEEAIENNNLCYGRKVVGDFCNTDDECTLNIEGPVSCDGATRRCSCSWGYVPELENTICVSSALQLGTNIGIIILALIFSFSQKLY